ncbi:MAG TPA: hypothetical protein VFV99_13170 [Kofleriaceae bacterium]|nr:hypothetical protein [Kofleriaceae bacterium]
MAYRGDDAGDAVEAPTAEGLLKVLLGPNRVDLSVAQRSLHIADRIATLVEHKKQKQDRRGSVKILGNLVVARGFPREDVGLWIEHLGDDKKKKSDDKRKAEPAEDDKRKPPSKADDSRADEPSMQRIFGVEPVSLLERDGLGALGRLDVLAQRLRAHLADLAGPIRRAIEIGSGHALDKVLLADHGDHYMFYARRLFRDRARFAMAVHDDGRIVVPDGKTLREVRVTSRFGITVRGDYIRFADPHGTDLAKVSLPWLGPEDRDEVARRIGQFVDRE